MNPPINAGTFQEYDYNNEDAECEWKQITEYWRLNGSNQHINYCSIFILVLDMATREKVNKQKVLDYVQHKTESNKQMKFFQMLRKEVEIGANGTQKYVIKQGPNKGKIIG